MNEKMRSCVMGLILGQFSSPLPMAQKEPVAYLYNGVRLPKLPEWDKETYPYAVIRYIHNETNDYHLICLRKVVYVGTGVAYKFKGSAGVYTSTIATGTNGPWSDLKALNVDFTVSPAIWSNFDIIAEDGTVYLEASEPIPVYE